MSVKLNEIKQYGDFQTPIDLSNEIMSYLKKTIGAPKIIIEPTCGLGSFIKSALDFFPNSSILGFDISENHLKTLEADLVKKGIDFKISLKKRNFFKINWIVLFKKLDKPILVIGNPPWITSSEMSVINGNNIPDKSNTQNLPGMDALTGKSNFDISEWMIKQLSIALNSVGGTLAMLCKVSVARKLFMTYKRDFFNLKRSSMFLIDAKKHFNAEVNSCLFLVEFSNEKSDLNTCAVFKSFNEDLIQEIGFDKNTLIANMGYYQESKHLKGKSKYTWRSGIKHDAAKVMELTNLGGGTYLNGHGDEIGLESNYLYPMLKGSDLANGDIEKCNKWMLVPQRKIGEDTERIKKDAPLTWDYLMKNSEKMDKRKSTIYKGKPRFSIFGVGDYTFKLWKIAVPGFYKNLQFQLVPPFQGKPVVFDDTCYFLSTDQKEEAMRLSSLLNQDLVKKFYQSFIFRDAKRPITKTILKELSIEKLISKSKNMRIMNKFSI